MQLPVIVIDTETTGLMNHAGARVIEMALVLLMPDGSKPFALSTLVKPSDPDDTPWHHGHVRETMAIHGIPREHILLAPTPRRVDDLLDYVYRHVISTYGADWPAELLTWTSWRTEFESEMLSRSFPLVSNWQADTCIWKLARAACRQADLTEPYRPSLKQTARALGLNADRNAHRALPDALLAADVLHALINRDPTTPLEVA